MLNLHPPARTDAQVRAIAASGSSGLARKAQAELRARQADALRAAVEANRQGGGGGMSVSHTYGQPSRAGLTPQMRACLDAIQRLTRDSMPPTYDELARALGVSKGGVVLDPFAGSGSTGVACIAEGFDAILIEREDEYIADINRRIAWANGEGKLTAQELGKKQETVEALPLFGGAA